MKTFSAFLIVLIGLTTTSFGQDGNKKSQTYERKNMIRPFIVRWIKEAFVPRVGEIQRLHLESNGTFKYSYRNRDRTCGFMNHDATGQWKTINNKLILQPYTLESVPWIELIMEKGKLYGSADSLKNKTWAMKKRVL